MSADTAFDSYSRTLARQLGRQLRKMHRTCAVAESCTGGLIGGAITSVAGSSEWFRGGVIAYSNEVKLRLLGVPEQTLLDHGAVSSETVTAMAEGAARLCEADCAIAVSGVAGPGGGTGEKPVGLVFIGVRANGGTSHHRFLFTGDRSAIRQATVTTGLSLLLEQLSGT
ncbi:MAG: CinA family protein [Chitinispirillaceae bacterium]|nr:CinA family protein [Chitinispirillaceae bacterium]